MVKSLAGGWSTALPACIFRSRCVLKPLRASASVFFSDLETSLSELSEFRLEDALESLFFMRSQAAHANAQTRMASVRCFMDLLGSQNINPPPRCVNRPDWRLQMNNRIRDPAPSISSSLALVCAAAVGGESTRLSAGSKNAVTGNNDRNRVLPQGLADARGRRRACDNFGKLAVSAGFSRRYLPSCLVHLAGKLARLLQIQIDVAEILRIAREVPDDFFDRPTNPLRGGAAAFLAPALRAIRASVPSAVSSGSWKNVIAGGAAGAGTSRSRQFRRRQFRSRTSSMRVASFVEV